MSSVDHHLREPEQSSIPDASPCVIEVDSLSKSFKAYPSPGAHLRDLLLPGGSNSVRQDWALRNVTFRVAQSECVGVIGRNGSGKSTLLKLIVGTLHPTEGRVRSHGRVLGLLELGTGFNPEMTGRANVILSAQIQGYPADYAPRHMAGIEAFADIGPFFDRPVKTYSSGMFVRLAFATFMFMEPDIFIVDEALSVGDLFFQQKCFDAISKMKAKGTTFLFVSHDMTSIRNLCDRAIVLDAGKVIFEGDPSEAVMRYYLANQPSAATAEVPADGAPSASGNSFRASSDEMSRRSILTLENRMGSRALEIVAARCRDLAGVDILQFRMNEQLRIELLVKANAAIREPNVGIEIYDKFNMLVYGVSLLNLATQMPPLAVGETRLVTFTLTLSLMPGEYSLSVATADQTETPDPNAGSFLDRHEKLGPLQVSWDRSLMPFYGVANLPTTCKIESEIT